MDEQKETKETEAEKPTEDAGTRDKSETEQEIERIRAETERLNLAAAQKEQADARAKLAGVSTLEKPEPKSKPTDHEYSQKALRGEIDKE